MFKNERKLCFLRFCVFLCIISKGQTFLKTFSICNRDSLEYFQSSLDQYKLFLIGEYHGQESNIKIEFTYLEYLNSENIYPKYLIDEEGPSFGYLLTKFIKTGDTTILEVINSSKERWGLFNDFKKYYESLPNDKKFAVIGVDVDRFYHVTHHAVRDILLAKEVDCKESDFECKKLIYILNSFKLVVNPLLFGTKDLKNHLNEVSSLLKSKDSVVLRRHCEGNFLILKQIIAAYDLAKERRRIFLHNESKEFRTKREWLMINNLYSIYLKDASAICVGRFGSFHTLINLPKKQHHVYNDISMASILNNNNKFSLTNQKVSSNLIVYNYAYPKQYKFIKTNVGEMKTIFERMPSNTIFIKKLGHESEITNVILLKSDKK